LGAGQPRRSRWGPVQRHRPPARVAASPGHF
jgi:hypothetical protein